MWKNREKNWKKAEKLKKIPYRQMKKKTFWDFLGKRF